MKLFYFPGIDSNFPVTTPAKPLRKRMLNSAGFFLFCSIFLSALFSFALNSRAQSVLLPLNFVLVYNFTPTSTTQIVQSGASMDGSTIAYTCPPQIQGSGQSPSNCSIVTYQGISALKVAAGVNSGGVCLSTLGSDSKGFSISPPYYIESKQFYPQSANGWNLSMFTFPVNIQNGYEHDIN